MLRRIDSQLKKRVEAMSVEKKCNTEEKKQFNSQMQTKQSVQQIVHGGNSLRIHQVAQQPVDTTDLSLLMKYIMPASIGQRSRHLIFKNSVYIISNWTSDKFPNVIYICLKGYGAGYLRYDPTLTPPNFTPTDRVAALQLDTVNAVIDDSGVRTYQLKYVLRDSVYWRIPIQMTQLGFNVKVDEVQTPQVLPLPNPLTLNFQIRFQ